MNCLAVIGILWILIFDYYKCDEFCDVFKPNGTFESIRVYKQLVYGIEKNTVISHYQMFRNGNQWEFYSNNNGMIGLNTKLNESNKNLFIKIDYVMDYSLIIHCSVFSQIPNKIRTVCYSEAINPDGNPHIWFDDKTQYIPENTIIFNPTINEKSEYFIVWNKIDGSHRCYHPFKGFNCTFNETPKFLGVYDLETRKLIDDVVQHSRGHLIFFNIDSKPMYCLWTYKQNTSDLCKRENLLEYGTECNENKETNLYYIIFYVIVIIVVIAIICITIAFIYRNYCKRANQEANSSTLEEASASVTTVTSKVDKQSVRSKKSTTIKTQPKDKSKKSPQIIVGKISPKKK